MCRRGVVFWRDGDGDRGFRWFRRGFFEKEYFYLWEEGFFIGLGAGSVVGGR